MKEIKDTAVLIIDVQSPFLYQVRRKEEFVQKQKELLSFCRKNKIPVAIIEYYASGETNKEITDSLPGCISKTFIKKYDSAFSNHDLSLWLESRGIKNLILSGLFESCCVYRTAKNAKEKGYGVITSKDLISDPVLFGEYYEADKEDEISLSWYEVNGVHFNSLKELKNIKVTPPWSLFYFYDRLKSTLSFA